MFLSSLQKIKRLWREWPYLGLGMLLAVLALLGGSFYLQKQGRSSPIPQEVIEPATAAVDPWPEGFVRRFTDGTAIAPEDQPKRWFAVMVENSAEAWPLSGLSEARLVIEAPVEGNIPRFMAYFDETQAVEKIGPVRSLRPYYLDWALGFQAMPAHVGGSPEALSLVDTTRAPDLNEFYWGRYFWRSKDRYAPHNVYTSVALLKDGYEQRGYGDVAIPSWVYTEAQPSLDDRPSEQKILVPFSSQTNDYNAAWEYAREGNTYRRLQAREFQQDAEGGEVSASNVLVMFTQVLVIDEVGRREIRTEGEGKAWLFRDGTQFEVIWKKDGRKEPLTIVSEQGDPVALNPGQTWIEVVPLSTIVTVTP